MLKRISHSFIYVLDQDDALDFYVGKLGMVVHTDADLGVMRFLTLNLPDQPDVELVLMIPGPPAYDDATAAQVRELVTKGAAGGGVIFETDDCRGTFESLRAAGVEFTQEPTERFYGTGCALRDPFGNPIRFTNRRTGQSSCHQPTSSTRNPDDAPALGRLGAVVNVPSSLALDDGIGAEPPPVLHRERACPATQYARELASETTNSSARPGVRTYFGSVSPDLRASRPAVKTLPRSLRETRSGSRSVRTGSTHPTGHVTRGLALRSIASVVSGIGL